MTFRVGLLSLFVRRKTVEKHYPGGMAALRKRYRVIYEKEDLVMLKDMTDQDVHRYATHLAQSGIEAGRLLTMVDGLCGPHFVSPGIAVERSRNDRRWPPFNWTVRAAGAQCHGLGREVVEFPLQFKPDNAKSN